MDELLAPVPRDKVIRRRRKVAAVVAGLVALYMAVAGVDALLRARIRAEDMPGTYHVATARGLTYAEVYLDQAYEDGYQTLLLRRDGTYEQVVTVPGHESRQVGRWRLIRGLFPKLELESYSDGPPETYLPGWGVDTLNVYGRRNAPLMALCENLNVHYRRTQSPRP